MGKRVRFNTPGHAHELTFSCYRNRPFLSSRLYCLHLCEAISVARQRFYFHVWAYVLMPNHVHLLIYPTLESYDIAEILQNIKQSVSRRAIRAARRSGADVLQQFFAGSKSRQYRFWQSGGGYDRNIVSKVVLLKTINYIHNNPVRAGLVKSPEEWEWSSFQDWADLGCGPITIDRENISLS